MLVRWEPDAEALAAGPQESTLALSVTGGGTRQVCNLDCFLVFLSHLIAHVSLGLTSIASALFCYRCLLHLRALLWR